MTLLEQAVMALTFKIVDDEIEFGFIDLTPDPRISNLRPGWLADDEQWRDQLQAMTYDDVMFFERQWEMAGGAPHVFRVPRLRKRIVRTHAQS